MNGRALPLFGAAAVGFAAAAVLFSAASMRPASAQLRPQISAQPVGNVNLAPPAGSTAGAPQPISIQALDSQHFVVATREPRLVSQIGREGSAQQMLVTVVTYYTVRGDRLVPIEHVRVPTGFRAVELEP